MKRLFLCFLVGWTGVAWSNPQHEALDREIDSLLTKGVDYILRQEYAQATAIFQDLSMRYPGHPAGYAYQAAVLQTFAMDHEMLVERSRFDSLIALGINRAVSMVASQPGSAWGYFFRGSLLGSDSYARAERGDWYGAATKGMASAAEFQKAIDLDSTLYDAYAGLGTYYYWKTRKMEFLTWLPFVADRREDAVRFLKMCAEQGTLNRFTALSSLVSVLTDAEHFPEAVTYAQRALESYPDNRTFLWGLASALEKRGDSAAALDAYERLLRSIRNDQSDNPYNELVCRLNILKIRISWALTEELIAEADLLLMMQSREYPDRVKERAAVKLDEARKIRKALAERRGMR